MALPQLLETIGEKFQSGLRKLYNNIHMSYMIKGTALHQMTNDSLPAADEGHCSVLVLLEYKILIERLNKWAGTTGAVLVSLQI